MDIDSLLSAIVVGLIIGALGRLIVPGRQPIGCLLTIGVGILAALVGGIVARAAGLDSEGFSWSLLAIQVLVAAVGVAIIGNATRRRD